MSLDSTADVIVIGLGAFGSAVACQLAMRGTRVLGIDRHAPPHDLGSSHGATRITRLAVGEGAQYLPLVQRSHEIWRALEAQAGEPLYTATGGLIVGAADGASQHHGRPDFVRRTIALAQQHGIAHEVLGAPEVMARFPQFMLRGDEVAYYEPAAGVLRPERCIAAQLAVARRHGARLQVNEAVLSIEGTAQGVTVRTARATYAAARAVVTAGPWLPGLVGGAYAQRLRVLRQVLHWFRPTQPALYAPGRSPVFIWMHGRSDEDYFYGFPMIDGHEGVKVATEQYADTTTPETVDRQVSAAEQARMFEAHVAGRLRSVTPEAVHAAACLYTVSTDSGFIVDAHPTQPNVTVVSACSGHGFKHSAGLGEALAQQILGQAGGVDLSSFSLDRLRG